MVKVILIGEVSIEFDKVIISQKHSLISLDQPEISLQKPLSQKADWWWVLGLARGKQDDFPYEMNVLEPGNDIAAAKACLSSCILNGIRWRPGDWPLRIDGWNGMNEKRVLERIRLIVTRWWGRLV